MQHVEISLTLSILERIKGQMGRIQPGPLFTKQPLHNHLDTDDCAACTQATREPRRVPVLSTHVLDHQRSYRIHLKAYRRTTWRQVLEAQRRLRALVHDRFSVV